MSGIGPVVCKFIIVGGYHADEEQYESRNGCTSSLLPVAFTNKK